MDNFNFDKNAIDKLNSMLNNGNLDNIISQIPPDALKNFSTIMNKKTNSNENEIKNSNTEFFNNANNINSKDNITSSDTSNNNSSNNNSFDFNNIDINTIMKIKSVMDKMNHTSDPRSNLLQSLKPYLRDEKKSKLDQYSNLLNMASLIELFNQNNDKENSSD